ncbi:hypothetical protein DPMN_170199 [Dreissena polymorpha]|uniref:Secreted protein n=1 Tax=Dreissena polymorpha TaxID=45954 RepID=A0A9D4IED6_DREPO|nr:hypothetical protein DPMN_170199 [Dreissena polymorpha]
MDHAELPRPEIIRLWTMLLRALTGTTTGTPMPSQPNPHPHKGRLQGKVKEALRPMQPLRARTSQSQVSNHIPH